MTPNNTLRMPRWRGVSDFASQKFRVTPDDSLNFFLGKELQMFSRPVRKRTFESSQRQNRHEI